MNGRILRPTASFAVICGALAVFAARAQTAKGISIDVMSSRPELVAGGDALVRISGIEAAPKVKLGANDVSAAFRPDSKGGWIGLVEGLKDGGNLLLAQAEGKEASLTLVNHPRNATLFAGPQQEPFVCENETFGLEPAKDQSCAAPSKVEYFYRNKGGAWKRFDPGAPRPADLATTRTTEGREVPLIVRQEKGSSTAPPISSTSSTTRRPGRCRRLSQARPLRDGTAS